MVAPANNRRTADLPATGPLWSPHVVTAAGERIPGEALERLERLDDAVFAALAGDAGELDAAVYLWRDARHDLSPPLLAETRAHYESRARSRWRRSQERPAEGLAVGFAALAVLDLLGTE